MVARWLRFEGILSGFSLLSLVLAVWFTYFSINPTDPYAHYAVVLLATCAAGIQYTLCKCPPRPCVTANTKDLAFSVYFLLLGLILGFHKLGLNSIWLDEELQLHTATNNRHSVVFGAAFTQVPLNYFYTALAKNLFGYADWGARFFSVPFFAFSVVLFYQIARKIFRDAFYARLASFIYVSSPTLVHYAREARPYSCALFCQMLFVLASWHFFLLKDSRERFLYLPLLFGTTVLFFLSIALQTWIFAAAFGLALLLSSQFWIHQRSSTALYCGTVFCALLSITPIIYLMRLRSISFLKKDAFSASDIYVNFIASGPQLALQNLFRNFYTLLPLLVALAVLVLVGNRWHLPKRKRESFYYSFVIKLIVGYGLIFCLSFALFVEYKVHGRYLITILPIAVILGVLILSQAFEQLKRLTRVRNKNLLAFAKWLAAVLVLRLNIVELPKVYAADGEYSWNDDTRAMYQYMSDHGQNGDVAYTIPFQWPNEWERFGFLGAEFYFPLRDRKIHLQSFWELSYRLPITELILLDIREGRKPKQIFINFTNAVEAEHSLSFYLADRPGVSCISEYRVYLCRLTVKESLSRTMEGFLNFVVNATPQKEKAYRIYDVLMALSREQGNAKKCEGYLEELKSIGSTDPIVLKVIQNHEGSCSLPYAISPINKKWL